MKVGMGIAFIAAILALVGMAFDWKGTVESATFVGFDMLIATMFFAVGGCFSSRSPVKANTVVVLSVVAIICTIIAAIVGAMNPAAAVGFIIVGIILAVIGNTDSVRNYVDQNRLA